MSGTAANDPKKPLEKRPARSRRRLLLVFAVELLGEQTAALLTTPEGKAALKHAIVERANAILEPKVKVLDVLFAEFVVQF